MIRTMTLFMAMLAGCPTDDGVPAEPVDTTDSPEADTGTTPSPTIPIEGDCEVAGDLRAGHRVVIRCTGPATSETADPNPFTDLRMDVTFESDGQTVTVPGHFAADGAAADSSATDGDTWRAYFAPPAAGPWIYTVSFTEGTDVAIDGGGSPVAPFHGQSGQFPVEGPGPAAERDLRTQGALRRVPGETRLRFALTGRVFVEGGVDSPENLLAYVDFDNTVECDGDNSGVLHAYPDHASDWSPGDPEWGGGRGHALVGAINYLASTGVNGIYALTMTREHDGQGDDNRIVPWIACDERLRYDVSKLDQWEIVFEHLSRRGFLIHVVTQETENDHLLDNGTLGRERTLYYRELVSRFAHHPALQWNLGEENTNDIVEVRAFADAVAALDAYDHPIVLHTYPGQRDRYADLLGHPTFDGPTLQFGNIPTSAEGGLYGEIRDWIERSDEVGEPWVVTATEASGNHAPTPGSGVTDRQRVYWMWASVMSGGGGFEWYLKSGGGGHAFDHALEDFREFDELWRQSGHFVRFWRDVVQIDAGIDIASLSPDNGLTAADTDWVLADPGQAYVVFLREGGPVTLDLGGTSGAFDVQWFDPRSGVASFGEPVAGGGVANLGSPPTDPNEDWVVLVVPGDGEIPEPPPCDYETVDDVLVIEAEDLPLVDSWTVGADAEFSGFNDAGYIAWTAGQQLNNPGAGTMSQTLRLSRAGRYRLQWRNQVGQGTSTTDHNDTWVRIVGADLFAAKGPDDAEARVYPSPQCNDDAFLDPIRALPDVVSAGCPAGATSDGWFKVYSSGASDWSWSTRTSDHDPHEVVFEVAGPATVTFQMAARSSNHLIDRIVWHHDDVSDNQARDLDRATTACLP